MAPKGVSLRQGAVLSQNVSRMWLRFVESQLLLQTSLITTRRR